MLNISDHFGVKVFIFLELKDNRNMPHVGDMTQTDYFLMTLRLSTLS